MGCVCSSGGRPESSFCCVRVIHINGHVADFEAPVTVGQITGDVFSPVLCSKAQLLSTGSPPLRFDCELEPGQLYFLLPDSVWDSHPSPVDLAMLVSRLTGLARRGGSGSTPAWPRYARVGPVGVAKTTGRVAWKPALDTIEDDKDSSISETSNF